jgi:hypothetical protein
MLNMLIQDVEISLAIGATATLHGLKMRPDLGLVCGLDVIPRVRPVLIICEARWRGRCAF